MKRNFKDLYIGDISIIKAAPYPDLYLKIKCHHNINALNLNNLTLHNISDDTPVEYRGDKLKYEEVE